MLSYLGRAGWSFCRSLGWLSSGNSVRMDNDMRIIIMNSIL